MPTEDTSGDNALDLENEAYVGPSDEYKNHAQSTEEPLRSEHDRVRELEQRGIDWVEAMKVKTVDVSAALPVGIVTDVEGNVIDTDQPVGPNFEPVDPDGDPAESVRKGMPGAPDFAKYVEERNAARTEAEAPKAAKPAPARAGGSTDEVPRQHQTPPRERSSTDTKS